MAKDANASTSPAVREGLAAVGPMLKGVVDQGLLSGAVTLVWRDGEVLDVSVEGLRDVASRAPMRRDALFRIASMTKPITSVLALQMLEDGLIALDEPITAYAPEFKDMKVLKDAQGPLDAVYPARRPITFEDLLTHRAGLAYAFTSEGPIAEAHERALGDVLDVRLTPDAWMAALADLPLSYPPGERFHYSLATDVLGFVLGRIAKKPFRELMIEKVLGPLGMADTDFWVPHDKRDRLASVYRLDEETNALKPMRMRLHEEPPVFCSGGGGLISTADDYLRFARALLGGGEADGVRILKPDTVRLMTKDRLTEAQKAVPFMGLPFWAGQGFGLGVSVITDAEKQAWMGAGVDGGFGWPGAFGTWWRADPHHRMVLIYLVQNAMPLEPGSASQLATGQRMAAAAALPMFQNIVYEAVGR